MALIKSVEFISKRGKKITIRNLEVTEALRLRDDAVVIAETSPYIILTAEDFRKKTEEEQQKFISSHNESIRNFLIVAEADQKIVGIYNFGAFKDDKRKHRGSLGISLHQDYRREGIAKKLFEVALEFVKQDSEIQFVELDVMDCNIDAIELYKKVGFNVIHTTPQAYRLFDGKMVGEIRMRLEIKK